MTESQPEGKALFTVDLSGSDRETGGQAAGRIVGGIALLLLGVVVVIGCAVAFVASFLMPSLWEWAELIADGAWFVGAIGIGLVIVGFTLLRSGRRRRAETVEAAFDALAAFSGESTEPENPRRIMPKDTTGAAPPQPKPLV